MSTAVAAPSPAPMANFDRNLSPRAYAPLAPAAISTPSQRFGQPTVVIEPQSVATPSDSSPPDGKVSPRSSRSNGTNPKIIVKKEPPSSPSLATNVRHRPRKLDLNTTTAVAAPLSSRPSAGTSMQEVGLACLSPGFQTHDPTMREQLQRSISVRDQQRSIIESRLLKTAKGDTQECSKGTDSLSPFGCAPPPASKKRPPPGLSIVPPAAERFANERVIQSAPLGQTFTGRNQAPHPAMHEQPSAVSGQGPPAHAQPAIQTNNRLPPIADVFGSGDGLQPINNRPPFLHTNSNSSQSHGPPLPSPGFPPQTAHPASYASQPPFGDRPREFRSAEEAVHELTGGRSDLQPKIIRYGGRQPPTPPSPNPNRSDHLTPHKYTLGLETGAGRRRSRNEYEAGSSPPLGSGPDRTPRLGPFGAGRDSPATQAAKKEEFISLMSRAWDLFHS